MSNALYKEIVDYWFSKEVQLLWFHSTKQFDQLLKEKYEKIYEQAVAHDYDDWMTTALGCLALVILFDQIPLNIYRGQAKSFATEQRARDVALHAINQGLDKQLLAVQKVFLFLPFMHSEDMNDQKKSVELFEQAGLSENAKYARHHYNLVDTFGRFPHRNAILGRESTAAELAYLSSDKAFLG